MKGVIAAHATHENIHLLITREVHEPRKSDPAYAHFNECKQRMKAQGLAVCNVCGDKEHVEFHHSIAEFSMIPDVDVQKLDHIFGLTLTDDEFKDWAEGPGNMEPLCVVHHRGLVGVHELPEPYWNIARIQKDGLAVVQVLQGKNR